MAYGFDKRAIDWGTTGNKVNAQHLPANFTPSNYTPAQVGSEGTDKVSAHLKGLDTALTSAGAQTIAVYESDLSFNGSDTTKNVDVSSTITDARKAQIQLLDNANDYERIYCKLLATSATNVRVTTNIALPSGSYKLLVFENIS